MEYILMFVGFLMFVFGFATFEDFSGKQKDNGVGQYIAGPKLMVGGVLLLLIGLALLKG